MTKALIIGASGGIGGALVQELQRRGNTVTGLSRSGDGLDITDEQSIIDALDHLDGPYETIIVATGALTAESAEPEKTIKALDPKVIAAQFALNATGPALVLKHALRLLPRDRRSVFAVLSARVGSIGDNRLGGWYSYRASKSALNQLIHTGAIEIARWHKQAICCALHPGTVATALTEKYDAASKVPAALAASHLLHVLDGLDVSDTGGFFDSAGKEVPW